MTRTVNVSVQTQSQQLTAGAPSGGLIITLINAATGATAIPPQTVTPAQAANGGYTAQFLSVPAGTYTATAQNVDASGNPVGAAVTSAQQVIEDTFPYDVPVSITIAAQ